MVKRSMDELIETVAKLPFYDKLRMTKRMNDFSGPGYYRNSAALLQYDGYLAVETDRGVRVGDGDYYVYLWKHAWGDPFYVGSGKGPRWTSKGGRCDDFYFHLDAADAVVYLVLSGVDSKTAHLYERYVSANMTYGGYTLANGDNNAEYKSEEARERMMARCKSVEGLELTKKVENAVINMVGHTSSRANYRVTDTFLMEYGTDYFSRNYVFNKNYSDSKTREQE